MANASKLIARQALAFKVGDWVPLTTTSAGNAGGTTFICTQFSGFGTNMAQAWWALQTSGTNGGATPQYRLVTAFDGSTSTFTVTPAFSAQVASGVTMELHQYQPDLYTRAINAALRQGWPSIHAPAMSSALVVPPTARLTISTSSAANPTVLTTSAAHGLTTGQSVVITSHSVAAVNGTYPVTVTGSTTFTIAVTSTGGTGGYAQPTPYQYALPSGYSPRMITKVQTGGPAGTDFAGVPFYGRNDVSYSPDNTLLWFGREGQSVRSLAAGDYIFLFARKYLAALGADTTFGSLTTDTTATIEMEQTVPEWDLLLAYAKVELYKELANKPGNERRSEHQQLLGMAQAELLDMEPRLRMPDPERQDLPW